MINNIFSINFNLFVILEINSDVNNKSGYNGKKNLKCKFIRN